MSSFTNPYNFVPLEGECPRSALKIGKDETLTGYFVCSMELLTPLFVPNTSYSRALCGEEEGETGYEFCSYENLDCNSKEGDFTPPPREPVVPGSEIRGAVRSVYEAAFRGCMSTISLDKPEKLKTILTRNGGYQPCSEVQKLCPACKVFGMIAKDPGNSDAVGSRVRFTDALLKNPQDGSDEDKCFYKPVVLPEAGAPKPECVEFYTSSPYTKEEKAKWSTQGHWTYDYVRVKKNGKIKKQKLPGELPMIRGRKFYWHHDWKKETDMENGNHNMRQRIRPMRESNWETGERVFDFRVYFEKLSRKELSRLRWALDFEDGDCAHKLGRGKPYGLGSVRIHIEDLKLCTVDAVSGAIKLTSEAYGDLKADVNEEGSEVIRTLKLMTNWEKRPTDISYPRLLDEEKTDDKTKSYEWFNRNRKGVQGEAPAFIKVLPRALEECGENKDDNKRLKG